jgi:phage gpG-like protein
MPVDGIEVRGLVEAQRRMEQAVADLRGEPMLDAMQQATLIVQRDAKILSPVDTGRLRASIVPEIRQPAGTGDVIGVVGTNVEYAAAMELGAKPHWVPKGVLDVWAERHGVDAFLVARAIARRGLRPRRYLQGAFEQNQARIIRILGDGVTGIVRKANNE